MADFIQWNIRGLRSNYEDLQVLIKDYNPTIISLQETLVGDNKKINIQNFSCYHTNTVRGNALCIRSNLLFSPVQLVTDIEALAVRISVNKTITVCSIYLSPSNVVTKQSLYDLIMQLPPPFLLLGDFNGHSPRWGSDHLNPQGKIIEELLDDLDLCVLNDGSPTYLSPGGTSSPLDLAICDPSIFLDLEWKVH